MWGKITACDASGVFCFSHNGHVLLSGWLPDFTLLYGLWEMLL